MQMTITIDEMPENGEVMLISSFNPSFWKTQGKDMEHVSVTAANEPQTFSFKSTNEIWVVTRCMKEPCASNQFKLRFQRITKVPVE